LARNPPLVASYATRPENLGAALLIAGAILIPPGAEGLVEAVEPRRERKRSTQLPYPTDFGSDHATAED